MKLLLFVLILIGAGIVGLGFYRGWFHVGSDNAEGKSNVTLSVDKDKFREDRNTAIAEVKGLGHQNKDGVAAASEKTMDGTFVSVSAEKLTMADKDGKVHSHALASSAKATCDGKTCTALDLKAGMRIRVTTDDAAPHAASRIEALDKNLDFEKGA
jgi:hypothetical protein